MANPLLLRPGSDLSASGTGTVPRQSWATDIAKMTPPMPNTVAPEMMYYFNEVPNASMHRQDGKKIAFVNQVCATNLLHDQYYLNEEIMGGNNLIRLATDEEIHQYKMRLDPMGTMRAIVTRENEEELRARFTREIQERMANGETIEAIIASPRKEAQASSADSNGQSQDDAGKIAGTSINERLAALKKGSLDAGDGNRIIPHTPSILSPVGTDRLGGAAAQNK